MELETAKSSGAFMCRRVGGKHNLGRRLGELFWSVFTTRRLQTSRAWNDGFEDARNRVSSWVGTPRFGSRRHHLTVCQANIPAHSLGVDCATMARTSRKKSF